MILDELVASSLKRVELLKQAVPFDTVKAAALYAAEHDGKEMYKFKKALSGDGLSFICEVKKASPSKGVIAENFPFADIAHSYENAGADAVSVLTEPEYFKGSTAYLRVIAAETALPCLCKDFVVDEYQIYEARLNGASAVLLICAVLDDDKLRAYLELAHLLGMSALVETHNLQEAERAVKSGAEIIGINNRDLKTFNVDLGTTELIAGKLPENKIIVSESGIHSAEDIARVRAAGADAVLIGEAFMRADNRDELMNSFRKSGNV